MAPSHGSVFSQLNKEKAPGASSSLVLGASHSSSQPHYGFILRQKCAGIEMGSWTADWATAGCATAVLILSGARRGQGAMGSSQTDRGISGTALPRTRFDPRSHASTAGVRAGSVCPSGEHRCQNVDDSLASPNRSERRDGPSGSRSLASDVAPPARVCALEVRLKSVWPVRALPIRLERVSPRARRPSPGRPARRARSPKAGRFAPLVRPGHVGSTEQTEGAFSGHSTARFRRGFLSSSSPRSCRALSVKMDRKRVFCSVYT
jgi:hypothetical protein